MGPIDSHCHLQALEGAELDNAIAAARARGVAGFLVPATKLEQADHLLELCHRHPDIWCAIGVHPHYAATWRPGDAERLSALLADPKVVAVGECGLDFFYDHAPADVQVRALREQWDVALDHGLPVIVHNRDSNEAMLEVVRLPAYERLVADFHSFAGGRAMAEEVLAHGHYLGLSGMITFPKADNVREVLAVAPRERLLVETDTPYLAPVPYRGKPNRPAYVVEVADHLAGLLGLTPPELAALTNSNFATLFPRTLAA